MAPASEFGDEAVLRAVLDRIIPRDDHPSACEAGVDGFILGLWRAGSEGSAGPVAAGLARLSETCRAATGRSFAALSAAEQDTALAAVAAQPWFRSLCELAAEGYYADPGNGGNRGAASWAMIGYRPRLPDGPDGPAWDPRDAVVGKLWA